MAFAQARRWVCFALASLQMYGSYIDSVSCFLANRWCQEGNNNFVIEQRETILWNSIGPIRSGSAARLYEALGFYPTTMLSIKIPFDIVHSTVPRVPRIPCLR